jgi:hypothetical protein
MFSCYSQLKFKTEKISGRVIGYIPANFESKHNGYGETLIVKVKRSKNVKAIYVKLTHHYFEGKDALPKSIFSGVGWRRFKVTREEDCDSVLHPDYSSLEMMSNTNDHEKWTMDEPPKVNFINPEDEKSIPADEVLPCYVILSLRQ